MTFQEGGVPSGDPGEVLGGSQLLVIPAGTGVNGVWNTLASLLVCPDPTSLQGCTFSFVNNDSMDHQISGQHPCQGTPIIPANGGTWQCHVQSSFEGGLNGGKLWISTSGAMKYQQHCAACHGPHTQSAKAGANATQIQNAINSQSNMASLNTLPAADIQSIAAFLVATLGAPSGGAPLTGEELYAFHCASCHNNLQQSEVRGENANDIADAIQDKPQMRNIPALQALTAAQIQAIADALDF